MLGKAILSAALICSATLVVEPGRAAAPEVRRLDNKDLSIVIGAYVESPRASGCGMASRSAKSHF